jgi:hypothetical protein
MPTTDLQAGIKEILDEIREISEIRRVPEEPPENNDAFPFVVGYPSNGVYTGRPNVMKGLHNVAIELHVARKDLPRDYNKVMGIIDEIPYQLQKLQVDSGFTTIATFGEIEYTFGVLEWGNLETLGVTYIINNVKVETIIT